MTQGEKKALISIAWKWLD